MTRKITVFCGIALLSAFVVFAQGPNEPGIDGYSLTIVQYPYTDNAFLCASNSVNEPPRAVGCGWNGDLDLMVAVPFEYRDQVTMNSYFLISYEPHDQFEQHSFLWEKGELTLLPNPIGGTSTNAGNLNDAG